jgi:preprotein translocase subunit SecF
MFVVRYRKIFFTLSAVLLALSLYSIFTYGFNLSIDFKGGSITEVSYDAQRPTKEQMEERIAGLGLGNFSVRSSGERGFIIRTKELNQEERNSLNSAFAVSDSTYTIERSNSIGPVAGAALRNKSVTALSLVLLMILIFVTFAFWGVSRPVSSWKYGLVTIIALFHDVLIPVGVFTLLGHIYGIEIDLLFVSGLLAILGFSVHDTIVMFDRIRENLKINQEKKINEEFDQTVGRAVTQTITRSINTSLTLFIMLVALYFFGSSATRDFTLLLILGTIVGVYSSIFIASPLLVTLNKFQKK